MARKGWREAPRTLALVAALGATSPAAPVGAPVLTALVAGALGAGLFPSVARAQAPYTDAELRSVESADEARIRQLRDQEITQLRITLGRRLPAHRRADLYYRLAQLYLEGYHAAYVLEGRVHDQRIARGDSEPAIDHSHSRPCLTRGVSASQELINLHIPYDKLDEVYYFLAFNYGELGDAKRSARYYGKIIRQFPTSPFVAEAYRKLGDAAYGAIQYRKAQGYYEAALRTASPDLQPEIYQKLAWCYYRTQNYDRAIQTMKLAISSDERSGEKYVSLREEALRDMAIFMTESGRVDEAIAYFRDTIGDKDFYPGILEKLARQYEREADPDRAEKVYESLIKARPGTDAAYRANVRLVEIDLNHERYQRALDRLHGFDVNRPGGDEETRVAARNLRALIRRTATESHEKFRKRGDRDALRVAEGFYAAYLSLFLAKDDPRHETPEIQMYLADVKRELGKSAEASVLYQKVVDSRDPRYAKQAGALWTQSLADSMKKQAGSGGALSSATGPEPSRMELDYVAAADRLQASLGNTAETREAQLRAAQVLAGHRDTEADGVRRARAIIDKAPGSTQADISALLWLQIASEPGNEAQLGEAVSAIRANSELMAEDSRAGKGKLRAALADADERLRIKAIDRSEKARDFGAAARGYESFARDSRDREPAEKAYESSVASYVKAGDSAGAGRVASEWLRRFPGSARAAEAIRGVATQALIDGRFDASARLFERLGRSNRDPDSVETAARIYDGMGDAKSAQGAWRYFADSFRESPHRGAALVALARSFEVTADDGGATRAYRECMTVSRELEAECGARLADLYFKLKTDEEGTALLRKVAALKTRAKGGSFSPYVGYARFRLAEMLRRSRTFDRLELPDAHLKKALSERLGFLEPLSRAYNSVVEAGGPWAIAALDALGSWAMGFADDVDSIDPPSGADPAAVAKFRASLKSVSDPLRRKAIETWQDAYRKAVTAEALSPVVPELADRLADYRARSPSRAQGAHGGLRLSGIEPTADPAATRARLSANPRDAAAWVDYGNLLWGMRRPGLARIAYERALALDPSGLAALNNRAVTLVSGRLEDWKAAGEAYALFVEVLHRDEFFAPAKINRAILLNYYRLFEKARPLWDQVLVRNPSADAQDGIAVAWQGLGNFEQAQAGFDKATRMGASPTRFALIYHQAARQSLDGRTGAARCVGTLDTLAGTGLSDFEKAAVENLRRTCVKWNVSR